MDFQQIPWRNGRFDPGVLEQRVENSDRLARLWTAWRMHPGTRTIVFCCSQRHAVFSRDWLRNHDVKANAVFVVREAIRVANPCEHLQAATWMPSALSISIMKG